MTRSSMRALASRFCSETSGNALIEFAYTLPLLVGLGGYGIEMANLAVVSHKVSQSAMALSDNMSRIGQANSLAVTQIREADVNDSFIGVKRQTEGLDLTNNGRIILSSLEQNAQGGQWIHWQRCIGTKNASSAYGPQGTGATGTGFLGMGPASSRIQAPPDSAVMFVEVVYDYKPLFTTMFIPARVIRFESSFIVRDSRDLTQIYNPSPAAPVATCATFAA
jgi:hypothetical protein